MLFKKKKAQSFIEFALVLPLLILVLLGVVELTLFLGTYINLLDLTREAARFASNRDPNAAVTPTFRTCTNPTLPPAPTVGIDKPLDFFYDTSCIFSPLQGSASCSANDPFCNGFNSTIQLKHNEDDILIYVFTESGVKNPVTGTPEPRITDNLWCKSTPTSTCPWVWSDNDTDTVHNDNWQRKCTSTTPAVPPTPNFYPALMQSYLSSGTLMDKAFVVVEVVYCYHQVLNIPILTNFLPNPMVIDTYSIMPLPAAQPTLIPPTLIPTATP
jgi:hypothetical protein